MNNIYPSYLKKFRCIADKCPDTCCAGWEIVVDGESERRYFETEAPLGEKLRRCMTKDADGDTVFASENGRCPFLMKSGLCEVYRELGEEALCRTCDRFPRFECVIGSRREAGLSLSCPEAARLIFEDSLPTAFETEVTDEPPQPNTIDPTVYFTLSKAQKTAMNILSDRNFSIGARIKKFLLLCAEVAETVDGRKIEKIKKPARAEYSAKASVKKYFECLRSLERLGEWRDGALSAGEKADKKEILRLTASEECEAEYEKLLIYLAFRYFMTAAFDGELLVKAKLFAMIYIVVLHIQAGLECETREERITVLQRLSRELEHSAENLEALCEHARKSKYFSLTNLINILDISEDTV